VRVGFLALQTRDLSPSQRFRVEAFEPWLASQGVSVETLWTLDRDDLRVFYGPAPAHAKARVAARALARRLRSVTPTSLRRRYDAFFVQREAFFLAGAWSEWLAHLQAPIVYDFDDAVWIHAVSEANRRFAFLKNVEKIPAILQLAHSVIAGNEYLAAYARQFNPRVQVVPTCVDVQRYVPRSRPDDGTVVLGWSGSASTVAHFRLLLPVLGRLQQRYGARLRFKVVGDAAFRHEGLGIVGEAWTSESEVSALQAMDIGLMPLPDDEWSKGKCGLKGLTYMAVGVPAVLAAVGVNTELVQDGVNGFTPRTEDEWVSCLSQLVEDAGLRRRLGEAGRRTAVEGYSVQRWRPTLLRVLQDAAASRR
jgi:glycosyltransferase involved in cell wall biosynthesis